jgi:hypothetical protein
MGSNKYPLIAPPGGGRPTLPSPGQPAPMRPDEFSPGSIANITTFGFDRISPPASVYIQRDDLINIFANTQLAAVDSVTFMLRFLRVPEPQGGQPEQGGVGRQPGTIFTRGIVQTELEVLSGLTGSGVNRQLNLGEGYLLSMGAVSANATLRGQTFARAQLIRSTSVPFNTPSVLFSDYVTKNQPAGWPSGRNLHMSEGVGWLHSRQIATPAGGADWTFTTGAVQRIRIIALQAQLAVANSGAARPVEVVVDDGANLYGRFASNTAFPINVTSQLMFGTLGTPPTSITTDIYVQMPSGLILPPTHRIRSVTTNIVAGDTWSNIWMLCEEWLDAL